MKEKYRQLEFGLLRSYISELTFFIEVSDFYKKSSKFHSVCYPEISDRRKYFADAACDPLLANKEVDCIVSNDIDFGYGEPFWFLLGANGGGKTTYLRSVGSNLILFLCGCPVFAKRAYIYPFSSVVTHFPKDERFTAAGRLTEEKLRVDSMLENGGDCSFYLFNETFSGTDDVKGYELAFSTARVMVDRGIFGLFVTHFHNLENEDFPVLQALTDPENERARTFKICRSEKGSMSHAADILKKYGLDKYSLAERRK